MYTSDVREETGAYSRFQEYSKLTKKARDWVYDIYIQKKESRSSNVDSDHLLLIYYSKKKKKNRNLPLYLYTYIVLVKWIFSTRSSIHLFAKSPFHFISYYALAYERHHYIGYASEK